MATTAETNTSVPQDDSDFIAAEESRSEDEEGYESGFASSTTSLSSSVADYEYENGRRYHAYESGKYTMPNDETEQDRLDMLHHVFSVLLGGESFLAPLKNPQRILDIGTGTGIWALDVADQFPQAKVTGIDLSPIQPTWVLPNVQFIVDDAEADWVYAKESLDYIHIRCMRGAIKDWPRLFSQAFKYTKPGGYLEVVDFVSYYPGCDDGTYAESTSLWRYYKLLNEASQKRGVPLSLEVPFVDQILKAGFSINGRKLTKLPMGSWPANKKQKEVGKWAQAVCETGFEAYGLALLTRQLGMNVDEVQRLIEACKKELCSRKIHIYIVIERIVARKPCDDDIGN